MRIAKKLNNNAIKTVNSTGSDVIVTGKGIGFNLNKGDEIDPSRIEQVFCPGPKKLESYEDLLAVIPFEYLEIANAIMKIVKQDLDLTISDSLFLNVSDHIFNAVKHYQEGIQVPNYLLKDIRRFYPKEFKAGLKSIRLVNQEFNVHLSGDEAGFLAFHFVDSDNTEGIDQASQIVQILRNILNIIRYQTSINLTNSTYFRRLIVHLKFFIKRMLEGQTEQYNSQDTELLHIVQMKYPQSSLVVDDIMAFLKEKYHYEATNNERLYLIIHIENAVKRSREDNTRITSSN
ncbi:MAG: PRD domain-containing protein [Sporolactobacillus sp.]